MKLPPFPKPQIDYEALWRDAVRVPPWLRTYLKWAVRVFVVLTIFNFLVWVGAHGVRIHFPMFSPFVQGT